MQTQHKIGILGATGVIGQRFIQLPRDIRIHPGIGGHPRISEAVDEEDRGVPGQVLAQIEM